MLRRAQQGFTLIELVVVITILGILAAFALPRFITLDSTARIATINGLAGSVKSAASLARGMSMASQNATQVTMEGNVVTLVNNYPDSSATGIATAVNTSTTDFTVTSTTASGTTTWAKVGAPDTGSTTCQVVYTPPATADATPTVTISTGGC